MPNFICAVNKLIHTMNSKRRVLLLFMSLVYISTSGQKNGLSNLVNHMSKEFCRCFAESGIHNFDSLNTGVMQSCFSKYIQTNKKIVVETAKNIYGDTSDISGLKLATELFKKISSKLVYDCDIFYNALIEDRRLYYKKYYQLNKDSIETILEAKNRVSARLRDAKYYHLRGCEYFYLHEFSSAVNDFDSAEVLDEKFFDINIYYKAQMAELLGNYEEAITEYEIFAKGENMNLIQLYADMLLRKTEQKDFVDQSKKTKDGISIGDRIDFISDCMKSADKKTINMHGVEINKFDYCTCFYDNLMPTLYSYEIKAAIKNNSLNNLLFNDKNLKILLHCFSKNSTVDPELKFSELNDSTGISKKIAISTCVTGILKDSVKSKTWSKKHAEDYCKCAVENLYAKGYSFGNIENDPQENNKLYNAIIAPCFNLAQKDENENGNLNTYRPEDIIGNFFSSKILLLDYLNQGYKIKISIAGRVHYYVFDTGASDLIIDRDYERDLLLSGILTKKNYLGTEDFTLANGQTDKVQLVRLNNVKIGDYTVNNVIAGISDGNTSLCGKGFLDKFRKWEFDTENKMLTLFK